MEIPDHKVKELKKLLLVAEAYIEDGAPKTALERIRSAQKLLPDKAPAAKKKAPAKSKQPPKPPAK